MYSLKLPIKIESFVDFRIKEVPVYHSVNV